MIENGGVKMRGTWTLLAGMLAMISAGVGFIDLPLRVVPSAAPAAGSFNAAPPAAAILHASGLTVWSETTHKTTRQERVEFWHDPASGDARFEVRNPADQVEIQAVRHGTTVTYLYPLEHYAYEQVAADVSVPYLLDVRNHLLGYQTPLAQKQLSELVEGMQDGRAVVRGQAHAVTGTANAQYQAIDVTLDKTTGLLL